MTLTEAKEFILFCKANQVYQAKFGDLEFIASEPPPKHEPQPTPYELLGITPPEALNGN